MDGGLEEKLKKKKDKKEKKEKKEKKKREKEKAAQLAASNGAPSASSRGNLEEVYEDDQEYDGYDGDAQQRDHSGSGQRRFDDLDEQRGGSSRQKYGHSGAVDMDDLDANPNHASGRRRNQQHGGLELDEDGHGDMMMDDEQMDLDADLAAEMEANGAELDLDYHPPPPKTTQQVALAGAFLVLFGVFQLFLFGYLSTASEVWSLIVSGSMLCLSGLLALRAANETTIISGVHYRLSLQVYMITILLLSGLNILLINRQACRAPFDDPTASVTVTCAHILASTIAISAFGLFFPLFLFCLPCYLGSGIHIENLQLQESQRSSHAAEARSNYRIHDEESKY